MRQLGKKKVLPFAHYHRAYRLPKRMRGWKGRKKPRACQPLPPEAFDAYFMRAAMEEARVAEGKGEVPVGAILVRGGRICYRAHNLVEERGSGIAHAELLLLEAASKEEGRSLKDFTLYVSLEPCLMCAGAMLHARVGRLVFGAYDRERGAFFSQFHLADWSESPHHLIVRGGVLGTENRLLLQAFFARRRRENKELRRSEDEAAGLIQ